MENSNNETSKSIKSAVIKLYSVIFIIIILIYLKFINKK
jgi:hypothetical protein